MKKVFLILAGIVFSGLAVGGIVFLNPLRSLLSLRQVDGTPLYVMQLYGDAHFTKYLQSGESAGVASRFQPVLYPLWGCTTFTARDAQGLPMLGRNFDWNDRPALLLFNHPKDGYESVAMLDLSYLQIPGKDLDWPARLRLLNDAAFFPFDGMNERGVAIGMMALDDAEPAYDPHKVTIGTLAAIRLVLDYASNLDEAVGLLGQYNIEFSNGPPVHFLITDSSGKSAVIEFQKDGLVALPNAQPWQVCTNIPLAGKSPEQAANSCWRYQKASQALEMNRGVLSREQAMSLLKDVSQTITQWSVVYHQVSGEIDLARRRDFNIIYHFQLKMAEK